MCLGSNYDHITFKPGHFGFLYVSPPVNLLSKQKRMMHHGMRKKHELKVKRYTDCIIDLIEYLAAFPGTKIVEKISET